MARPTKRTPELVERILSVLKAGNTRKAACDYVGINESQFARWRKRFADFADAVRKAEAEPLVASIARIRQAGVGGQVVNEKVTVKELQDGSRLTTTERAYTRPEWTADAWFAERKYPGDWGRRDRIDVNLIGSAVEQMRRELAALGVELTDEEAERWKALAVAEAETITKGKR